MTAFVLRCPQIDAPSVTAAVVSRPTGSATTFSFGNFGSCLRTSSACAAQSFKRRSGFGNQAAFFCNHDDAKRSHHVYSVSLRQCTGAAVVENSDESGILQRPRNYFCFARAATPVSEGRMNFGR